MPIRRRLFALLAAAVVISAMSISALAHDVPDTSRRGSIHVTMHTGETAVPGGSLTLYRVGEVRESDGNYDFVLTGDFSGSNVSLDDVQSAGLAQELAAFAAEHQLSGMTGEIGKDGTIAFADLQLGLYLLIQNEAADGYNKADPFLVSVPMLEEGVYIYNVDASPKVELEKASEPDKPKPSRPTGSKLPQTGQLNWPVLVLAASGLTLFAIGWILRFGKRRDGYEK